MRQDILYALRLLRRSPLFTATAVLSLTIGIGANATIFSIASALMLRPLPGLTDPARLVDIGRTQSGKGFDTTSYPNYLDVRDRVTTVSDVYAYRVDPQPMSLGRGLETERIYGSAVSGNYFRALGTSAWRGRLLSDVDDRVDAPPAVVISYELWQRRFGGSPDAIGGTIAVNGRDVGVVGVAPPRFQGTTLLRSDLWIPLWVSSVATPRFTAQLMGSRQSVWLMMGGRLKPGVTPTQATAELSSIAADLERAYPDANRGKGLKALTATVVPGRIEVVAGFLGILLGIVGLVLMVACVNIAGMSLARAAARRREIAVRLAIGASRWRLIRQLLTETTVLFVAACAAGVLLSRWLVVVFLALLPQLPVPVGIDIVVDWRVMAFAVIVSLAAAVFSGLAPALQASRPDLVPALKVDALDGSGRLRLRSTFVVGQITMSLLLIIAAGLFIRALERAARIDPGFTQQNVDVITLDLSLSGFKTPEALGFVQRLTTRLRATPAVQSVSIAADLPLDGSRMGFGNLTAPGVQPPPGMHSFEADWNAVTPGFFQTLGVRLVSGRDFTDADVATAPGAIIVNEAMAKRVWGTTDVLGRRLEATDPDGAQHLTVVGVASDAQLISLGERVEPYVYVPLAQRYDPRVSILVKSTTGRMIPETRAILRALDPNLPVTTAMPLSDVTALELIPQRLAAAVAGSLGVLVLLLAAIGIYGVTSYAVTRRTREIGIRMALGANRPAVIRLIVRQGVVLTATGVGLGLAAGAAGAQILRSLLFGVSALDPVAFGGAALLFTAVSLLASYLPARRATQVDPMQALRQE